MFLITELDVRELELALAFDIGLLGAVDHDVRDVGIVEQLLERPQAQQFVDQHLFERELLAAVERELQLGQHLDDDRAEFLGQLFLVERGGGFGIDALQQARQHLFLDAVDRAFKPLHPRLAGIARQGLTLGKALHRIERAAGDGADRIAFGQDGWDGGELIAALALGRACAGRALHRPGDTECRAPGGCPVPCSTAPSKCTHADTILRDGTVFSARGFYKFLTKPARARALRKLRRASGLPAAPGQPSCSARMVSPRAFTSANPPLIGSSSGSALSAL